MADNNSSINLFFPVSPGGLTRQQFLTEVLLPQIPRGDTENSRSALARLIYDDYFKKEIVKGLDEKVYDRIISSRGNGKRNKVFSPHPKLHRNFEEQHGAIKEIDPVRQREYEEYVRFMSNIYTSHLAAMTPYVKLIYRYRAKKNDPWKEIVFPFKSFTSDDEFIVKRGGDKKEILEFSRGDGAGIQNLTLNRQFPGIGNILSATIDINFFFQNLTILTKKQEVDGLKDFTFMKSMSFLNPKTEQLVVEYGYGISRFTDPTIIPPRIQTQIMLREKKRFIINYKGHTFNFEQNGTINLSVSYTTQQDVDLFDKDSDVAIPKDKVQIASLGVPEDIKLLMEDYRELLIRKNKLEEYARELTTQEGKRKEEVVVKNISQKDASLTDIQRKRKKNDDEIIATNKLLNSLREQISPYVKQKFVETITKNRELFKISFKSSSVNVVGANTLPLYGIISDLFIEEIVENKPVSTKIYSFENELDLDSFKNNVIYQQGINGTEQEKESFLGKITGTIFNVPKGTTRKGNQTFGDILFFPLRALITAAYTDLADDYKKKVPFVGLGNVETKAFGRSYTVNIGDILVSVDKFQEWYYRNYTAKRIISYSFGDFLNDIMTKLVPELLENETTQLFGNNRIGTIRPITYVTKMKGDKKDKALFDNFYLNGTDSSLKEMIKRINSPAELKTDQDLTTVAFYTNLKNPSNVHGSIYLQRNLGKANFNEETDIKFNSPHIKIGADAGLLKSINFSAQDLPYLRTALWAELLVSNEETLLKYRYSAAVTTIGNNVFFQGGYFAIPANPLGISSDTHDPGIVGYYSIHGVTDTLTIGNYETSINGTWVYNPLAKKSAFSTNDPLLAEDNKFPYNLNISSLTYLEDLFRLDSNVLKQNGLDSKFEPLPKDKDDLPPQNDNYKDIKEPV